MTPSTPGLGVTIDTGALRKFGKRFFVMDRKRLIWYSVRNRGFKVSMEIDRVKKEKARKDSTKLQSRVNTAEQ